MTSVSSHAAAADNDQLHASDLRADQQVYEKLAEPFRPLFDQIRQGVTEREHNHSLPFAEISSLKKAGFGAIRVPTQYGGKGASLPHTFRLLTELAAADSNITQALRAHFAFVEDWLSAPPSRQRDEWFRRFVAGETVGNAWTEVGQATVDFPATQLTWQGDHDKLVLNGSKYYTTGSIFAEWIDVFTGNAETKKLYIAPVPTNAPGVEIKDDWNGFGQQTTGTGTINFTNVVVFEEDLIPFERRFRYQTAFYQLFHIAALAGIAEAATRAFTEEVRNRKRIFTHGNASSFAADPQIQQVIGEGWSTAYAAQAIAEKTAIDIQEAYFTALDVQQDPSNTELIESDKKANVQAEIASAQGQVVSSQLVVGLTGQLFDALAASATSKSKNLDRFWRNARTIANHNPAVFKAKVVGDYFINGTEPVFVWGIGLPKA